MKFRIFVILAAVALGTCTTMSQQRMTDPQIAMVMRVANLSEVREGELARKKATDAAVRDFATAMVSEHSAQSSKADAALSQADVAAEDTLVSREMDAASGAATERLRALSGRDFDRAYIDRQVQAQEKLLGLIDSTLTPDARHKVLRTQLTELRGMVEKHFALAKQIQSALPR
jgi:putative membrane protein